MDKTTSGKTAPVLLALGNVPCTTVVAGSVTDPKIPTFVGDSGMAAPFTTIPVAALGPKIPEGVGDSWRPAVAGLLGAVPLAVAAAMTGVSLMGTAVAAPHASAVTAQACVTTTTGALGGQLKFPECLGD